jgi:hypothetical protein
VWERHLEGKEPEEIFERKAYRNTGFSGFHSRVVSKEEIERNPEDFSTGN